MDLFPDKVILHIFRYLNAKDMLLGCAPTCRRLYILSSNGCIWYRFFQTFIRDRLGFRPAASLSYNPQHIRNMMLNEANQGSIYWIMETKGSNHCIILHQMYYGQSRECELYEHELHARGMNRVCRVGPAPHLSEALFLRSLIEHLIDQNIGLERHLRALYYCSKRMGIPYEWEENAISRMVDHYSPSLISDVGLGLWNFMQKKELPPPLFIKRKAIDSPPSSPSGKRLMRSSNDEFLETIPS